MNDFKNKDENGACGVGANSPACEFSNYDLKPKKKDICIHKKTTGKVHETASAIKEEEV